MEQALVSVILPAYNAGPYIAEAVYSILAQTYTNFELILINDASTDTTKEEIQRFDDARIVYLENEENSGLIYTLNKGLAIAKGKYIIRMDADDASMPNRIEEQVAFMDAYPNIGVSGTGFRLFGAKDSDVQYETENDDIKLQMLYHCRFCHPSVIIRKQLIDDNKLQYSADFSHAEDYELWARLAFTTQFANLPKILLKYRVHQESVSHKHTNTQRINSIRVIEYLFSKIGVQLSPALIPMWIEVCYANFNLNIIQIETIEKLMQELLAANAKSGYVQQQKMEQFIAAKWYNLCYNNAKNKQVLSLFKRSSISKMASLQQILKLRIKALL